MGRDVIDRIGVIYTKNSNLYWHGRWSIDIGATLKT